jgi:hypothetical protein
VNSDDQPQEDSPTFDRVDELSRCIAIKDSIGDNMRPRYAISESGREKVVASSTIVLQRCCQKAVQEKKNVRHAGAPV